MSIFRAQATINIGDDHLAVFTITVNERFVSLDWILTSTQVPELNTRDPDLATARTAAEGQLTTIVAGPSYRLPGAVVNRVP